jgi:hypothetical protein
VFCTGEAVTDGLVSVAKKNVDRAAVLTCGCMCVAECDLRFTILNETHAGHKPAIDPSHSFSFAAKSSPSPNPEAAASYTHKATRSMFFVVLLLFAVVLSPQTFFTITDS